MSTTTPTPSEQIRAQLDARIAHLITLSAGWYDDDDADSISPTAAANMRDLMGRVPDAHLCGCAVFSLTGGGLQAEWVSGDHWLCIESNRAGDIAAELWDAMGIDFPETPYGPDTAAAALALIARFHAPAPRKDTP